MNPLMSLTPLAAVHTLQSLGRPLSESAAQFVDVLSDKLSGVASSADTPPADGSHAQGGAQQITPSSLLEKLVTRAKELLGGGDGTSISQLDVELSPLGHVYLNSDDWRVRDLENVLGNDDAFRDLLGQWSARTGQSELRLQLDSTSNLPQST